MSEQPGSGFPPPLAPFSPPYAHLPPPVPPPPVPWVPVVPVATMPGTVRAATIVTYVCAAIAVAMTFLIAMFVVFVGSFVMGSFERSDRADFALVLILAVASAVAFSALGCWFAWQAGRRKNWGRIGLAVCSGITVVLSLLTLAPPTVPGIAGGAAVLVLLFLPESNAWFRDAD